MADEKIELFNTQLSPTFLQAIGAIVANFAELECIVESNIWKFLFGKEKQHLKAAKIATAGMAFKTKISVLAALWRERLQGKHKDDLQSVVKLLRRAEDQRNKVMHSRWKEKDKEKVVRRKITAHDELNEQEEEWTTSDLIKVNELMMEAQSSVFELFCTSEKELGGETPLELAKGWETFKCIREIEDEEAKKKGSS